MHLTFVRLVIFPCETIRAETKRRANRPQRHFTVSAGMDALYCLFYPHILTKMVTVMPWIAFTKSLRSVSSLRYPVPYPETQS